MESPPMEANSSRRGLLIGQDLVFVSQITGVAGTVGLTVAVAPGLPQALTMLAEESFAFVLIDLTVPGLSVAEVVQACGRETCPRVVAFGPHVHDQRLAEAREAGCDEVLTRGQFASGLPQVLARCATSAS